VEIWNSRSAMNGAALRRRHAIAHKDEELLFSECEALIIASAFLAVAEAIGGARLTD
jgi:hypothetical protein